MIAFLLYTLKVAIGLILFYFIYKIFLSYETFFRINRTVLLAGTIICFILPFLNFPVHITFPVQTPAVLIEEMLVQSEQERKIPQTSNPDRENGFVSVMENRTFALSSGETLSLIFSTGCLICLAFVLKSYFSMMKIIRGGEKKNYKNYKLILSEETISPFSWQKFIIISREDYENNPDEILMHEIAHIQSKHSTDLILFELLVLFQWFNPAVWLLRKELRDIHEYQADMHVLQSGIDATRYQLLLVKKAVGSSSYTLANSFNHSKIKKRITMMLKEKSTNWAKLKLLFLLPVGLIALQMSARETDSVHSNSPVRIEEPDIPVVNKSTESNFENQENKIEYYDVSVIEISVEKLKKDNSIRQVTAHYKSCCKIRMSPSEYEAFLKNCIETTDKASELKKESKWMATSQGYWTEDNKIHQTETFFHLLTDEQAKELKEMIPPPPPLRHR